MSRLLIVLLLCCTSLFSQSWSNKEDGHHAGDRKRWFYGQRTLPDGSIPSGARRNALLQMQRIDAAVRTLRSNPRSPISATQAYSITTDSVNWTPIGPRPTDRGPSATSGRVNSIAIDPRDNNTIYIGAAAGGVWKTTDAGANWKPLTDDQPSLAMGAVAIDPTHPDTIYAGTGEENFAQDSYYGAGILKSIDGGSTWRNIVGPFSRDFISAIAVHPNRSEIVMVAAQSGLYRSTDSGESWTAVLSGVPAVSVFFDPANPGNVWASLGNIFGNTRNGVYRSTDAGANWQAVRGSGTATLPTTNIGRIELTMSPSNSSTLYAQIQNSATATFGALLGIWKSTDSGNTWTRLNVPTSAWGTQVWFTNTLRVSPRDANLVFAGALVLYRSQDGGATWTQIPQSGANGTLLHVDIHALAFTPDGSRLIMASDGGVHSTTEMTATRPNWNNLNTTLEITQFYPGMAIDASDASLSMGGTQDNGTQRHDSDGNWSNIACGDGGYTAIDPAFPSLSYAACQRVSVQRNPGLDTTSFVPAMYGLDTTDTSQFIAPLVMDLANTQILYFGTTRVWQARDSGGRWSAISGDLTAGAGGSIASIAIAPSDSKTVYVGTSGGKLQMTSDALAGTPNWLDRSAGLPPRNITRIVIDPVNSAIVYVTFSKFAAANGAQGYIFKSTDAGATWTNITGNLPVIPVNDLVIDPDIPDTLYIGTDVGVQVSTDGGATWSSLGKGLPQAPVLSLALQRRSRVLRAGTHGRSVWEIALPLARASLSPFIDTVTPSQVDAGGAGFSLSVTGGGFVPGTTVRWNGQDRSTTYVDSTHVTATIPAGDVTAPGRASVTAFNASTGGGPSLPKGFLIGGPPQSSPSAFVNAAYAAGGSALSPFSIASLYGTNLAGGVAVADAGPPLPYTLGGTTLILNGGLVPLFFVSPTQINFQIPPASRALPATLPLTIVQGTQRTTITVQTKAFAPALFTTNAQGTGQASTVIAGTATLVAPRGQFADSRPAKPGEFLSIYCTGLGDVLNRPAMGAASPSNPLAATQIQPVVTIGGVQAQVQFSGLAPGFVGLYQVNVKMPDGVSPGGAVPLSLTIGGVPSNIATIAVDPAQ